jgi:hypothetical protein
LNYLIFGFVRGHHLMIHDHHVYHDLFDENYSNVFSPLFANRRCHSYLYFDFFFPSNDQIFAKIGKKKPSTLLNLEKPLYLAATYILPIDFEKNASSVHQRETPWPIQKGVDEQHGERA